MMTSHSQQRVSKYALSDLAIRSALALERFGLGKPLDDSPLTDFVQALSGTAHTDGTDDQTRYFAIGYHRSYMRFAGALGADSTVDAAQEILDAKIKSLQLFIDTPNKGVVQELADFCADIHNELAQSQLADIRLAKRPRKRTEGAGLASRVS